MGSCPQLEHVPKTFYKCAITRLVGATTTGGVQLMKNIWATIRDATPASRGCYI
jgi:hypothetical protein